MVLHKEITKGELMKKYLILTSVLALAACGGSVGGVTFQNNNVKFNGAFGVTK